MRRLSKPIGYWPWVFRPLHLESSDESRFLIQGAVQQESYSIERPLWIEYLFLQGDLEDARLSIDDLSAARRIVDNAPAILYQVPQIPELRRNGELLQLAWPEGAPISHRLPSTPLFRGCCWSITWHRVYTQPKLKPLQALFLCRWWTQAEIDRAQGR